METVLNAVLTQYGPVGAIIIFFLYKDWKREEKRDLEITAKNAEYIKVVTQFISVCNKYEQQNKVVIHSINANTSALEKLILKHDAKLAEYEASPQLTADTSGVLTDRKDR